MARVSAKPVAPRRPPNFTLEQLLTHPKAFGLSTATAVQRAWCRIIEGRPIGDLAVHPDVVASLGCEAWKLPGERPKEIYVVAAIRCGKSLLAAACAFYCALTVDLSTTRESDEVVVSIVSLNKRNAKPIYKHVVETVKKRPLLAQFIDGTPTRESIRLRRPHDGRLVTIEIVAGSPQGGALAGTYSAGCIFDEAPRMTGEKQGSIINFDEQRRTVLPRLVPGAPLMAIGSPWAPRGPIWDAVQDFWGQPCKHLIVLRGTGPMLNPYLWTPEKIEELRASPQGDTMYRTDILGEFADPESGFFTVDDLTAVTRTVDVLPRDRACEYFAAMDPAAKSNSWTLVIVGKRWLDDGSFQLFVAKIRQWSPKKGDPLRPERVLEEIRTELTAYGITQVVTDQWSGDALAAIGRLLGGLELAEHPLTVPEFARLGESLRTRVRNLAVEIPPDRVLRADLLSIRKLYTATGYKLDLPVTADGRHADYVPAMILACEVAAQGVDWINAMDRARARGTGFFE